MGKPVKIFDIAKKLCKIYNKNLVEKKNYLMILSSLLLD